MPRYAQLRTFLAKRETTYGTDAAPVPGTDAILVRDVQIAVEATDLDREIIRHTMGDLPTIRAAQRAIVRGAVELAGSGTAGTAPKYGPILRACAMSETITGGQKVEYKPVSTNHDSVTLYWFLDGFRHRVLGARGTGRFVIQAQEIPRFEFELTGLYDQPTDTALASGTYTGWQLPRPPNKQNTPTFTVHGVATIARGIEVDLGNEVLHRNFPGVEEVLITKRSVTGQVTVDPVPVATKAWFAIADNSTLSTLQVVHGTTAGNIIELSGANVQVFRPEYEFMDRLAYHRLGLRFCENAGDDDFTLTVR